MYGSLAEVPQPIHVVLSDSSRMESQLLVDSLRRDPGFLVRDCPLESGPLLAAVMASAPCHVVVLSPSGSPPGHALGLLRTLQRSHPQAAKILLADSPDRDLVVGSLRSGARGIFSVADHPFQDLCKCIRRVAAGQVWLNTSHLNFLLDLITEIPTLTLVDSAGRPMLTPRHQQVAGLVAEGLSNRQIAVQLGLSEHTIKKYLFCIFERLGISTRVELVLYAVSQTDSRRELPFLMPRPAQPS